MPVPGQPRNPQHVTTFDRFDRVPFTPMSRLQSDVLRHTAQRPGSIRRFWRAAPKYVGGANGQEFSWTDNDLLPRDNQARALVSTRLNYIITTTNTVYGGNQLSRPMQRPVLVKSTASAAPRQITNGNVQGRPVLRQRIPSFGSRVPALNS